DQVDRALSWLIRQQGTDGFLGGSASRYARMYCHAIATYALAEALGMQTDRAGDARLREPIRRAVQYIIANQNPTDGGWRYERGQRSDMSMFGWQLMALKSSQIAGIEVPDDVTQKMIGFLKQRSLGTRRGLAAYRMVEPPFEPLRPSSAMTAESLFCKQMLGLARDNPQSQEAIEFLMDRLPNRKSEDLYYWYYGTLAVYQYGGPEWRAWNTALRDWLVTDQRTGGHAAGSWDPKPPWGPYGGRVFSTALSTLSLEVYYRFLPLYQVRRGMEFDDNE
ncbi:MAG: prenyltransferase/squalene oxidase repeat-containing protein, partial [Planctomycetaceae bacterium]